MRRYRSIIQLIALLALLTSLACAISMQSLKKGKVAGNFCNQYFPRDMLKNAENKGVGLGGLIFLFIIVFLGSMCDLYTYIISIPSLIRCFFVPAKCFEEED